MSSNRKTAPSRDVRSVEESCIMMSSDEPVKPLRGSPLGVHTILCLGRRSLCFWKAGVGRGSWHPRQCWSVPARAVTHPGVGERIGQQIVLPGDFLFRVGRQTSRTSGRSLRVVQSDPFCVVRGCTRPPPGAFLQSQRWLCCVRGEAANEPVLPSSADASWRPFFT